MVGAEYCDKLVCLSVCMSLSHTHISETACPNFNKPFIGFWLPRKARLPIFCACYLLWRCCDTLCTSDFLDDVMFAHNGEEHAKLKRRILKVTGQVAG